MKIFRLLMLVICLQFITIGCASYTKWSKPITTFSNTSAPELAQVKDIYSTINNVHLLEQESILVDKYAVLGYHPNQIVNFLSKDELKIRIVDINNLQNYITLIGNLASGKDLDELTAKNKLLTQNSSKSAATKSSSTNAISSFTISQQEVNSSFKVLDSITRPIIQHKIRTKLPYIIAQADPIVQNICTFEIADMAALQIQAQNDYNALLLEQSQFIYKNKDKMSPIDLRSEIIKLVQLQADAEKTNNDIVSAQEELKKMAETHHKLAMETK